MDFKTSESLKGNGKVRPRVGAFADFVRVPGLLLLSVLVALTAASAGFAGDVELEVRSPLKTAHGNSFFFRPGVWFPLAIEAFNSSEVDLDILVAATPKDPGGIRFPAFLAAIHLPAASRKVVPLYAMAPAQASSLRIHSVASGLFSPKNLDLRMISRSETAVLLLDDRGGARGFFSEPTLWPPLTRVFHAAPPLLPGRPEGFESFDWLVAGSVGEISGRQGAAVEAWVRRGGNLLMYYAPGASECLVKRFFAFSEPDTRFVSNPAEPAFQGLGEAPVALRRIRGNEGEAVVTIGGLPALLERPFGLGRVLYLTMDPLRPPLRDWAGRGGFLRPHLLKGRRLPTGAREDFCRRELCRYGCRPQSNTLLAFLLIWALVIGPIGFFAMRRAPWWRLSLVFGLLVSGFFVGAAHGWGGKAMDTGPVRKDFVLLYTRAGASSCFAETYRSVFRFARGRIEVTGSEGELVGPVFRIDLENDLHSRVEVGGQPRLSIENLPAGKPVLSRHLLFTDQEAPRVDFQLEPDRCLRGRVKKPPGLRLREKVVIIGQEVYGGSSFHLGLDPKRLKGKTRRDTLARLGLQCTEEGEEDCIWSHAEGRHDSPGPNRLLDPLPRGARFDPASGRVRIKGMLAARWKSEGREPVSGAREGLLHVTLEVSNPPGKVCLPPGALAARWLTEDLRPLKAMEGKGPCLEGATVRLPEGSAVVAEFELPVPGQSLRRVELGFGMSLMPLAESPAGETPSGLTGDPDSEGPPSLETDFFLWREGVWAKNPEDEIDAVHPADGRCRCRIRNAGKTGETILDAYLVVKGSFGE